MEGPKIHRSREENITPFPQNKRSESTGGGVSSENVISLSEHRRELEISRTLASMRKELETVVEYSGRRIQKLSRGVSQDEEMSVIMQFRDEAAREVLQRVVDLQGVLKWHESDQADIESRFTVLSADLAKVRKAFPANVLDISSTAERFLHHRREGRLETGE
jgi:hypothetical protein